MAAGLAPAFAAMNYLQVRVAHKRAEATGVASFELRDPDGRDLPPFSAGAHVDVVLRDGLVRQYSLCNAPHERHRYVLGVLRCVDSRGGSAAMHDELREGQIVRISAPRNLFALVPSRRSLLFAGGIGITPLLCMAESLDAEDAEFELHYSARSPEHTAFRERLANARFADRVHFHFDDGSAQQKLDLASLLGAPDAGTHLYVCGPAGYIAFVTGFAEGQGWRKEQVHVEHFAAAPPVDQAGDDTAFTVEVASTGRRYEVPANKTIFEVLDAAGVVIPTSCEQGICGSCLTRVLGGVPEHRDTFMTEAERARNDQITVCCSRARSPLLVLDL